LSDPRLSLISVAAGEDLGHLFSRLEQSRIEIIIAPEVTAAPAGHALVYQLATLTSRLFDNVHLWGDEEAPAVAEFPLLTGRVLAAVRSAMRCTRTALTGATGADARLIRVFVGDISPPQQLDSLDLYVGASEWGACLSISHPQQFTATTNPVGALAAGALASGEVFKLVFSDVLRGSVILGRGVPDTYSISLLTYSPTSGTSEPRLPDDITMDVVLFGCGSIGCGVLLGLLSTPHVRGRLTVVDNGVFDETNPYKYTLLDSSSAHAHLPKAIWAKDLVDRHGADRFSVYAHEGTAYDYVASLTPDYRLPLVVSAVDTVEARMEIQDTLPRFAVNAGVAGTTAEVSVHAFADGPCLACLGITQQRESWSAKPIADRLGLEQERVYELIISNSPLSKDDLQAIGNAGCAGADLLSGLDQFLGQPLLSLYNRALYSEAALSSVSGAPARVTTAFVSAFAGVLVLAELLKKAAGDLQPFLVRNSYRQELLGIPADGMLRYERDSTGRCLCHSAFRQLVYRSKYPE
jgi:hypothetical protein